MHNLSAVEVTRKWDASLALLGFVSANLGPEHILKQDGTIYRTENLVPITLVKAASCTQPNLIVTGRNRLTRSSYLANWIISLAQTLPPSHLRLVFLHHGGRGSVLDEVARTLPHTAGVFDFSIGLEERMRAQRFLTRLYDKRRDLLITERTESGNDFISISQRSSLHPEKNSPLIVVVSEDEHFATDDLGLDHIRRFGPVLSIIYAASTPTTSRISTDIADTAAATIDADLNPAHVSTVHGQSFYTTTPTSHIDYILAAQSVAQANTMRTTTQPTATAPTDTVAADEPPSDTAPADTEQAAPADAEPESTAPTVNDDATPTETPAANN